MKTKLDGEMKVAEGDFSGFGNGDWTWSLQRTSVHSKEDLGGFVKLALFFFSLLSDLRVSSSVLCMQLCNFPWRTINRDELMELFCN